MEILIHYYNNMRVALVMMNFQSLINFKYVDNIFV